MFALKTDGKVQASFASEVEKITGYIQRTYEDGSEVAESLTMLARLFDPRRNPGIPSNPSNSFSSKGIHECKQEPKAPYRNK
jgi:hypothetical protein